MYDSSEIVQPVSTIFHKGGRNEGELCHIVQEESPDILN